MVYETYETDAYVLSAHNVSEGNRLFILLTKDFGLLRAHAQSVRSEKSKLRYNLQVFSKTAISLVRGKEYWRIVGAKDAEHFFVSFKEKSDSARLLRQIFNLLLRLIQGEGRNEYLFSVIDELVLHLTKQTEDQTAYKGIELITVARILYALGYFSKGRDYEKLLTSTDLSNTRVAEILPLEKDLVQKINTALKESHL